MTKTSEPDEQEPQQDHPPHQLRHDRRNVDGIWSVLPEELIRLIYSYADLPSLGHLACINKSGYLCRYAIDDQTWREAARRRFGLVNNSTSRQHARNHGANRWMDAYRSMAVANRMPRSKFTLARRIVFAKGNHNNNNNNNNGRNAPVQVWVMIQHTENCQTRTLVDQTQTHFRPNNNNNKYIELSVCVQNTHSSHGPVRIDPGAAHLSVLSHHLAVMTRTTTNANVCAHHVRTPCLPSWRVTHLRRCHDDNNNNAITTTTASSFPFTSPQDHDDSLLDSPSSSFVVLNSFDFCVLSLTFPCGSDLFETDFLARAVALHMPYRMELLGQDNTLDDNGDVWSLAHANFMSEKDYWNCYSELPGGFLSLNDRYRMLTV